jgi:hypothetical protein
VGTIARIRNPNLSPEARRAFNLISQAIKVPMMAGGSLGWKIVVADEHADAARASIQQLIEQEGIAARIVEDTDPSLPAASRSPLSRKPLSPRRKGGIARP